MCLFELVPRMRVSLVVRFMVRCSMCCFSVFCVGGVCVLLLIRVCAYL